MEADEEDGSWAAATAKWRPVAVVAAVAIAGDTGAVCAVECVVNAVADGILAFGSIAAAAVVVVVADVGALAEPSRAEQWVDSCCRPWVVGQVAVVVEFHDRCRRRLDGQGHRSVR